MTRGRCGSLFLHRVILHSLHLTGFPGAQGAEHDVDRRRLPPELSDDCIFVEETGECGEQELNHSDGQAEKFYRDLKQRGICVRVGMEATGYSRWFERLLAELGFELWIGDPAEIKAKRVKKQKFDREDARLLLRLGSWFGK